MDRGTDLAPVVRCSALAKVYGDRAVLADVDLAIRPGERCCLVGVNGSGKTTLLEILMGLKLPTHGRVEVFGREPSDSWLKRRRVLVMDRAAFPYYAKVKEIVWMHAGFHPEPIDAAALLAAHELDGNRYVRHLSKGQRQRLNLLITLLGDPSLILMDEPTSGLDPKARLELWRILDAKLRQHPDRTLIFATHDLGEAERWADRVAVLHGGRLLALQTPQSLCRSIVGSRRKVTIIGLADLESRLWGFEEVASVAHFGPEVVFYTDQPDVVLRRIGLASDSVEIRIENVSLRDAFLKLTGDATDEAPALAV